MSYSITANYSLFQELMTLTQLTTLLQSTIIIHAYYKQNTPLFLSWLAIYSTSIIYHFTKIMYPVHLRTNNIIFKMDIFACCILYISSLYDFIVRNSIIRPYSDICISFHIFLPTIFIYSSKYRILMWNPDSDISELWHAIFHILIYFDNHLYLYKS
jgi:hypothetical protein